MHSKEEIAILANKALDMQERVNELEKQLKILLSQEKTEVVDKPSPSNRNLPTKKEDIIARAVSVHGNKYDYSLLDKEEYYLTRSVIIICKEHGEFKQVLENHITNKHGCGKCGQKTAHRNITFSSLEFFAKAKAIHGDRYDYSLVVFTGYKKKVTIICKRHGQFQQEAGRHINGTNCQACGREVSSAKNRPLFSRYYTDEELLLREERKKR